MERNHHRLYDPGLLTPRRQPPNESNMRGKARQSVWILGLGAICALSAIALFVWLSRAGSHPIPVETGVDVAAGRTSPAKATLEKPTAAIDSEASTPSDARAAVLPEPTSTSPAAWSFRVIDRAEKGIEGAELLRGDRVLARSDARGGVALGAQALDLEHTPRGVAWSVRHPRYRRTLIDSSRIGRIEYLVLDDPWHVVVHVRDEKGSAVGGATCALHDPNAEGVVELARAVTDSQGTAEFADVLAPVAALSISAKGFEPYLKHLRANDESDREVSAVLAPGVDLEVRVADSRGRPVSSAEVQASYISVAADVNPPASWLETTNEKGVVVLAGFPSKGRFMELTAQADGYSRAVSNFVMSALIAEKGIDLVLVPDAKLRVRVRESDGTPREATLGVYYADATFGASGGARVTPTQGGGVGDYTVLVRAKVELNLHAGIHGAAAGSVQGLLLQEGETRDVDVIVPRHVALDVRILGLESACLPSDVVTLTTLEDRRQAATGPPGRTGTAPALSYRSSVDAHGRARMWVQPGSYRAAFIHENRALITRDVQIRDAQELALSVDAVRSVSGSLCDKGQSPLVGWTIVAREQGGRRSYSARTGVNGLFALEGVMPDKVNLWAEVPDYELSISLVESIAPPASNLELEVGLGEVEVHTFDRDDGAKLGALLRVSPPGSFVKQTAERATDDAGLARLELPVGSWKILAANGDRDRTGSTVVDVREGAASRVDIFLRKIRMRSFTLKGAADADAIVWTALEGPDAAEGRIALGDAAGIDTDLPDGRTRFELAKDGQIFGAAIEARVVAGTPVVLEW